MPITSAELSAGPCPSGSGVSLSGSPVSPPGSSSPLGSSVSPPGVGSSGPEATTWIGPVSSGPASSARASGPPSSDARSLEPPSSDARASGAPSSTARFPGPPAPGDCVVEDPGVSVARAPVPTALVLEAAVQAGPVLPAPMPVGSSSTTAVERDVVPSQDRAWTGDPLFGLSSRPAGHPRPGDWPIPVPRETPSTHPRPEPVEPLRLTCSGSPVTSAPGPLSSVGEPSIT